MKQHTIWDNYNIDIDDYDDDFWEWYTDDVDELSDYDKYEIAARYINDCFDDEMVNLDIPTSTEILAIADLGLWNGRRCGYRELGRNVNEIFRVCEDYNIFTCDRYNVRARCIHHDGSNYILFRRWRDDTTYEQRERLLDALYCGEANERMIRRYTKSIADEVKNVYGWK